MLRRSIVSIAGGMTLGAALPVVAQSQRLPRLGFLGNMPESDPKSASDWKGIYAAMKQAGLENGKTMLLERRYSFNDSQKHFSNAEELVAAGVDLIYATANDRLAAAYKATKSIPIVTVATNIVELGYAKSLARPGGNVTGMELQAVETVGKPLELLLAIRPNIKRICFLRSAREPNQNILYLPKLQTVGSAKGVAVVPLFVDLETIEDIELALAAVKRENVQALWFGLHRSFFHGPSFLRIQDWAAENKVVTVSGWGHRGEVVMTHGPSFEEIGAVTWRQAARILLSGAKPVDVPIEQPLRFDIVINRKFAKAMGLTIPQSVMLHATEVIE